MREKLHTWIATKDEQAIRYLLKSKSKLEKMLRRECFGSGLDEMLMNETEASLFEELGIKMENLSLSEKNVLEKITGHGEYFNVQDARVVIQWINHADLPSAKKKEIQEKFLKRYLTEISLSDLIKHGIIDEKKAKE